MYLSRKLDEYLSNWKKDPDRKPVIIKGARQIGKTKSIEHFSQENYDSVIQINFAEEPQYHTIIQDGYNTTSICKNITLHNPNARFIEGKTLIFFDEIQAFPDIANNILTIPYYCAF